MKKFLKYRYMMCIPHRYVSYFWYGYKAKATVHERDMLGTVREFVLWMNIDVPHTLTMHHAHLIIPFPGTPSLSPTADSHLQPQSSP